MRNALSRARLLVVAFAVAAVATAAFASASATASAPVVRVAKNATLGRSILVTRKGFTLYSLSAETHGRFICTDSVCLSLWTPLVVSHGSKPTGTSHLATVKRPDGRTQVTYRGLPLYTFNNDRKPGAIGGNGFKDVGTWLVATTGRAKAPTSAPATTGGYGR
jgi:predicted lipoprotein with Yx(FWY)xxD motif